MNIVLIGLRGSGKTKIGKILAEKLKLNFVDLDEEIEKAEGEKISKIVEKNGWEYFREKEVEAVLKAAKLDKTVIATGGGAILNENNKLNLKKNGVTIYLNSSPKDCSAHIASSKNRPPLTNKSTQFEELKLLYSQRHNIYKEAADLVINRTNNIEDDTEKLIKTLSSFSK